MAIWLCRICDTTIYVLPRLYPQRTTQPDQSLKKKKSHRLIQIHHGYIHTWRVSSTHVYVYILTPEKSEEFGFGEEQIESVDCTDVKVNKRNDISPDGLPFVLAFVRLFYLGVGVDFVYGFFLGCLLLLCWCFVKKRRRIAKQIWSHGVNTKDL